MVSAYRIVLSSHTYQRWLIESNKCALYTNKSSLHVSAQLSFMLSKLKTRPPAFCQIIVPLSNTRTLRDSVAVLLHYACGGTKGVKRTPGHYFSSCPDLFQSLAVQPCRNRTVSSECLTHLGLPPSPPGVMFLSIAVCLPEPVARPNGLVSREILVYFSRTGRQSQ